MTKRECEMLEMEKKLEALMDEVWKDYYSEIGNSQLEETNNMFDHLCREDEWKNNACQLKTVISY